MHKCSVKGCPNMQAIKQFAMCNAHMVESIKKSKNSPKVKEDESWVHDSDMESRG